ncbi:MAG: maleylpyruvate isomerase N-terminal domain-containing protein [Nocardioides sp.]
MSRLDHSTYLQHLRDESRRFRDVLAECDPRADVPTCPDWRADDLLWHLAEVQSFWTWVVSHRPKDPEEYTQPERPADHAGLLALFDAGSVALADVLEAADPTDEAWTWSSDHTVGFIARRQAHEALIHRRDAELTAHTTSPFPAALAADGVEEVLDVMYGGCPPWGTFAPLQHYLRLDLTDTGDQVWVQLGRFHGTDDDGVPHDEDDLHVVADPGVEPDAVISGTAEALDARIWRRGDGAQTHLAGDLKIVDRFRAVIHEPIL